MNRDFFKSIKPINVSYYFFIYIVFQMKLAIARLRDWKDSHNPESPLVPPAKLRHRVHGSLDKESFLQTGDILAQNIRDLCAIVKRDIYSFESVLDFGCGSGRVIRNFKDAPPSCQFYGTDIDVELVSWCKKNLPNIRWSTNDYLPPLPFSSDTFDLIYSISVFTHLDEKYQHLWLSELQRIAKPGATIILSACGEHIINMLPSSYQAKIQPDGFMFIKGATGRLKLDKLPDFYQTSYHTREYIYREWSSYFDVVCHVERAINNHQDGVILRKP